jgi:hypothetical protein
MVVELAALPDGLGTGFSVTVAGADAGAVIRTSPALSSDNVMCMVEEELVGPATGLDTTVTGAVGLAPGGGLLSAAGAGGPFKMPLRRRSSFGGSGTLLFCPTSSAISQLHHDRLHYIPTLHPSQSQTRQP